MAAHSLTLSDDALLGEYVALDDLRGLLEQRVAVPPDLMAMVIRNGEVVSAEAGGNVGIGGLWRSVKDALIGQSSLRLLVADLKPFQMVAGINAVSRDSVPVGGEIAIEFQIDPENPSGVLGLMQEHRAVHKAEIMERLVPHLGDRAIEHVIGQVDAADLRGNVAVQDKVQAEVMRIVQAVLGDLSVMVNDVSLRWALNDEEVAAIEARDAERERERADLKRAMLEADLRRETDATIFRLSAEADLEKAKAATEDELRTMVLNQELAFNEARDRGVRRAELDSYRHEIEKLNLERTATLNAEIAGAEGEIEKARLRAQLGQIERETRALEEEHRRAMDRLDRMQEADLSSHEERTRLDTAQQAQDQNLRNLRGLQDLENEDEDRKARRAREDRAQEADIAARERADDIRRLEAQGRMTPEVINAINAGHSPQVAAMMVEQARAQASSDAEKTALMQQMMEMMKGHSAQTADQARHALETAMQGAVGVAQGAGGGSARPAMAGQGAMGGASERVACPDCSRPIPAEADRCKYCGWRALA